MISLERFLGFRLVQILNLSSSVFGTGLMEVSWSMVEPETTLISIHYFDGNLSLKKPYIKVICYMLSWLGFIIIPTKRKKERPRFDSEAVHLCNLLCCAFKMYISTDLGIVSQKVNPIEDLLDLVRRF